MIIIIINFINIIVIRRPTRHYYSLLMKQLLLTLIFNINTLTGFACSMPQYCLHLRFTLEEKEKIEKCIMYIM